MLEKKQSLINNLSIHLKKIEKQEQNESKHAEERKCYEQKSINFKTEKQYKK